VPHNNRLQRTVRDRVPTHAGRRAAAEPGRYAWTRARQPTLWLLYLVPLIAVSLSSLAQQPITGRPSASSEEVRRVATELIELIESKHACGLAIDAAPRLDGPFGRAQVWYTATGTECTEAQAELRARAFALRIFFVPRTDPPKVRNDNLTLLNEVIE
jgi:hypothetical protein